MKKENWQIGKIYNTVITDSNEGFIPGTGHSGKEAVEYFGGNLICESIHRIKDAYLIAAAPDMIEALQNLENYDNRIPSHAWKRVQDAIKKATNSK